MDSSKASGVPFVITASSKKDKTFLLADLIIDKVLINELLANAILISIPPISSESRRPSLVRVCDRKQRAEAMLAQMKCAVVANLPILVQLSAGCYEN